MATAKTLVLGIGNTLLTDEGAGIHALNLLQSDYPYLPNTTFLDGGTLSFTLASWIEDCDNLIVFDAAEFHLPPGRIKTLIGKEMDAFLGANKRSAHEVGLLDLIDIARLTDALPTNRALIGIQATQFEWGMQPSKEVQQAMPAAVAEAVTLIEKWSGATLARTSSNLKPGVGYTNVE